MFSHVHQTDSGSFSFHVESLAQDPFTVIGSATLCFLTRSSILDSGRNCLNANQTFVCVCWLVFVSRCLVCGTSGRCFRIVSCVLTYEFHSFQFATCTHITKCLSAPTDFTEQPRLWEGRRVKPRFHKHPVVNSPPARSFWGGV